MHEIEAALAQVRNAWIAGRPALDRAPDGWRAAIGVDDELALVALAGHATDVLLRQAPATPLAVKPLLPTLAVPLVPDAVRPRFRRLLAAQGKLPFLERQLVMLAAARGHAAHPADWLPAPKDDWAPACYAPWLDWVRAEAAATPTDAQLTAGNYEQWSWAERRTALASLRARDPDAARAIIAARASGEPPERRLRLVELLDERLSDADVAFLESLAKDRSERVQALARNLLARLGRGSDAAEATVLAAELAAMVELTRVGIIRRRRRLALAALKTPAQQARRRSLFRLVSLAALANALQASELELVEAVPEGATGDVMDFIACVGATGSIAAVRALVERLLDDRDAPVASLLPLAERLAQGERDELLPRAISRDGDLFETSLAIAGTSLGKAPLAALLASPNHAALEHNVKVLVRGDDAGRAAALHVLDQLLPRVGLLLDGAGARTLLDQITAWGLSPAEPRLDLLHFNASLTPESAT